MSSGMDTRKKTRTIATSSAGWASSVPRSDCQAPRTSHPLGISQIERGWVGEAGRAAVPQAAFLDANAQVGGMAAGRKSSRGRLTTKEGHASPSLLSHGKPLLRTAQPLPDPVGRALRFLWRPEDAPNPS
jgi:hypothetical protein